MACTALIVIDMINTYEHEDADVLVDSVRTSLPGEAPRFSPVVWRPGAPRTMQAAVVGPDLCRCR
ncbi:hypothetical protein [Streptomyces sp. NPDC054958]